MTIQDTYRDPLFIKWYIDPLTGQKIVTPRTNEPHKIVNNIIMLAEIPSEDDKVNIINIGENSLYEAPMGTILDENHFSVNYTLGLINLSNDYDGQTAIVPEYYSRGIIFYPSSRIYYELNESGTDIQSTLKDFTDSIIAYSYKGIYDNETSYEQNNQVYFQGSTYICIVPLSVGNVPTNSNYWRILGAGFDEKGEYSNSTNYYARDIVLYDNELYVAKITPPVGTSPTNTTYWDKLISFKTIIENAEIATQNAQDAADNANDIADSLIYLGDYNNSYPYKVRNFVRYQNSLYICKSDSTGHIPTNTTYWDNVSKAFTWKDAYNSSTSYTIFDIVSYLGSSYICILDSTNNIPTNTTYWSPMALKGEKGATLSPRGAYSNIETYSENDLVSYEGSTWTCKQTSTGNIPEIGSTYWDIFVLGGGTVTEVTSANTDISVSTGTTTPVLTLNSSTTKTANKIVKRDSSGNIVDVGDTSALATTDKSSVVAAINETVDEIDILSTNLDSVSSSVTGLQTSVGSIQTQVDNNFSDNEYQTPTIVGTQIRIVKNSNSKRLYFYLSADLSGGNIAISLDNGATSVPLKDIDGNQLTSLSKGYQEVVYNTSFFTLRPRGGGKNSDIGFVEKYTGTQVTLVDGVKNGQFVYSNEDVQLNLTSVSPTTIDHTTAVNVGNNAYYSSSLGFNGVKPQRLSNGWIVVFYVDTSNNGVFKISKDNGSTWQVLVTLSGFSGVIGCSLTSNKTDLFLLSIINANVYVYKIDSLTSNVTQSANIAPAQTVTANFNKSCYIQIDKWGKIYSVWIYKNNTNSFNICYSSSTDNGITWSAPSFITSYNLSTMYATEVNLVRLKNGKILLLYIRRDTKLYIASYNLSDLSSLNTSIFTSSDSSYLLLNLSSTITSDGIIHIVYSYGSGTTSTAYQNSSDNGITWTNQTGRSGTSFPTIISDFYDELYLIHYYYNAVNLTKQIKIVRTNNGVWSTDVLTLTVTTDQLYIMVCDNYKFFTTPLFAFCGNASANINFIGVFLSEPNIVTIPSIENALSENDFVAVGDGTLKTYSNGLKNYIGFVTNESKGWI